MSITERFEKTIDVETDKHAQDPDFARMLSTIHQLKRQGILPPTRYTLPLTDTIGRQLSQAQTSQADNA
jgi:hypothetical protein